MKNRYTIFLSIVALNSLVIAENIEFDKTNKLVTHTEFGYISTEGNTQTKTYALDSKIKKGFNKHQFSLSFDGQYSEDQDIVIKNKYIIELAYDYKLTNQIAFNYLISYKDDKFSGYSYQVYTGPGLVYKAISTQKHNLGFDGNILYAQDSFADTKYDGSGAVIAYPNSTNIPVITTVNGDTQDYTSFRVKLSYEWQMLKDLKFMQEASYRSGFDDIDNYFIYTKTSFNSKISDIFSAGMSYKVDYANMVADSKERTDRTLTATLSVDY